MVLGDEILQWLTDCGSNLSSIGSTDSMRVITRDDRNSSSSHHPFISETSASISSHSSSFPVKAPPTVNATHKQGEKVRDRRLLGQLSRELGKNLVGDGSRSSPLSPSDLAGCRFCFLHLKVFAVVASCCLYFFSHFLRSCVVEHITPNVISSIQHSEK
jgi:hypothetical protein